MQQPQQPTPMYPRLHDETDMQQQQQTQVPQTPRDHEEIPLHNMFNRSVSESPERVRIRRIFERMDTDGDGYLSKSEMRRLIKNKQCGDMPRGVTRRILKLADEDGDGRVDFEEFFRLSQEHDWVVGEYVTKYCRWIVPDPHREIVAPIGAPSTPDQIDGAAFSMSRMAMSRSAMPRALSRGMSHSIYSATTDGQYERSMTFCPPPLTMIVFSILEIVAFIVDVLHLKEDIKDVHKIGHTTRGPAASLFIYNPHRRAEFWRFATYMFVHIGVMHLLMNLLVQVCLGVALELVHCWWRVAMVYVAGVVAGSMGVSLASPTVYLAGASGGVYALITAHIATIIMNYREMEYAAVQLIVFLCYIVIDVGSAVYRQLTEHQDQISHMSHLCGAIAGLLVGIGVLRNLKVRTWERVLWWVAVTLFVLLMTAGVCVHIFLPSYFPKQQLRELFA